MPIQITHSHATKINSSCRIYDTQRGLHLWVKSATQKYWIYRNSKSGKRTDISLGSFPQVGVSEARKKASELAHKVSQGLDITVTRRVVENPVEQEKAITFEEFAKEIITSKQPEWKNAKHASQWSNTLKDYAYPFIGHKKLSEITTEDILKILQPIWQTKTETATRLRGRLERILAGATIKGLRQGVNPAQWRGHLDFLLPQPQKLKKVKHHSALPYSELPQFIEQLQGRTGLAPLALEFCILTASRTSEVIYAKRSEISENLWTVPAERMKASREHIVPLCTRAIQIIKKAKEFEPDSEYLFSVNNRAMSNMALLSLLKRMSKSDVTTHGFRSTFRDWVAEVTHHSPEVAEMSLAHVVANKVEAAYRRGNLLEKRRALLQDWEDFCLGNKSTNVLELKVA